MDDEKGWKPTYTELADMLELFFELSTDMVCIASADGHFKKVNAVWSETLGHSTEELTSHPWLHFVHPDDQQKTVDAARAMGTARLVNFENRYRKKDGSYVVVEWRAMPWSGGRSLAVARVRRE